ncbi:MAG: glycosyltransferase family 2 protein [Phycisphaerae bacterium]|jgi:glycosyltransferase involved in cell wall biosynthesis
MNENISKKVIVIIPAFNEEATVADVIKSAKASLQGLEGAEIVVVNDGSSDKTARVAAEAGAKVVNFTHNKGLGAAFRAGIQASLSMGADIIVNIDADGQFDANDIPKLIEPIIAGRADMVTASRFADPQMIPVMPWIKKWGNKRFCNIVNKLGSLNLHDVSCGFRAYSRDAAMGANLLGGHTYTHEVILDLAFRGLQIVEVPVKVHGIRKVGKSRVANNLWKYGWRSLLIVLRAFRDYRPMKVFGGISLLFLILSLFFSGFLLVHYFRTGKFTPYIFMGFIAGGFGAISLISYITALLAGMINRLRIQQSEQLFLLRKNEYRKK